MQVRVEALVGDERAALAAGYLARQLRAPFWGAPREGVVVQIAMPLGEGVADLEAVLRRQARRQAHRQVRHPA